MLNRARRVAPVVPAVVQGCAQRFDAGPILPPRPQQEGVIRSLPQRNENVRIARLLVVVVVVVVVVVAPTPTPTPTPSFPDLLFNVIRNERVVDLPG